MRAVLEEATSAGRHFQILQTYSEKECSLIEHLGKIIEKQISKYLDGRLSKF